MKSILSGWMIHMRSVIGHPEGGAQKEGRAFCRRIYCGTMIATKAVSTVLCSKLD